MKILRSKTSQNGAEELTFSQGAFLVSHILLPENEGGGQTSVPSGLKCSELYTKSDPLGLLVRMCLASSRWFSPLMKLEWRAKSLCSARVTYTERNNSSQSKQSVETSNVQDIPSNRLLFQLVPLARRTDEIECGLLPTPMANEIAHPERVEALRANGATQMYSRANGASRPNGLQDFLHFHGLLATPTSTDYKGKYSEEAMVSKGGIDRSTLHRNLPKLLEREMLLTPSASDGMRANMTMNSLKAHNKPNADKSNLAEQIAHKIGGGTSQLNPLFVAEMMGFSPLHTILPFLGTNGEKKQ